MGLASPLTWRGMEPKCALQKLERLLRHDDERGKGAPTGSLAISTVTVKHHDWFGCGFVANSAASASACEGCGYFRHILFCVLALGVLSFTNATNERVIKGQFNRNGKSVCSGGGVVQLTGSELEGMPFRFNVETNALY